ncbi:MAG TPA: hypothetical protein VH414_00775 [Lichenihabitans sp.]|jgi:hypothetical protein|nr:hypothetical protein [Lichenihabitans sp.]
MSALPDFYDASRLEQIAITLFHGWGYDFYRLENRLRADDLLVRSKASWLLGLAHRAAEAAEVGFRRETLPPPSREKPRPDPAALAGAQLLERLSRAIGAAEAQVRAQPAPENDRMTQRYRDEAATLARLVEADKRLIGQAELLRTMLESRDGAWMIANAAAITAGIEAIAKTLSERQAVLMG